MSTNRLTIQGDCFCFNPIFFSVLTFLIWKEKGLLTSDTILFFHPFELTLFIHSFIECELMTFIEKQFTADIHVSFNLIPTNTFFFVCRKRFGKKPKFVHVGYYTLSPPHTLVIDDVCCLIQSYSAKPKISFFFWKMNVLLRERLGKKTGKIFRKKNYFIYPGIRQNTLFMNERMFFFILG